VHSLRPQGGWRRDRSVVHTWCMKPHRSIESPEHPTIRHAGRQCRARRRRRWFVRLRGPLHSGVLPAVCEPAARRSRRLPFAEEAEAAIPMPPLPAQRAGAGDPWIEKIRRVRHLSTSRAIRRLTLAARLGGSPSPVTQPRPSADPGDARRAGCAVKRRRGRRCQTARRRGDTIEQPFLRARGARWDVAFNPSKRGAGMSIR
jgi:hypothetical protein